MRIVPHDLAVLAGAGLRFIGVDHQIMRPLADLLGHEGPFEPGRKTRAAAPALTRGLNLVDQPIATLLDDGLGAVPGAARARSREAPAALAVEIAKDAILVVEHRSGLQCCQRGLPADRRRKLTVDLRTGLGRAAGRELVEDALEARGR